MAAPPVLAMINLPTMTALVTDSAGTAPPCLEGGTHMQPAAPRRPRPLPASPLDSPATGQPPLQSTRLLDRLRERIRLLHYSRRTETAYVHWCRAFIRFHNLRHPAEMGQPEVEAFLSYLAGERALAPSSHRQALSALLFLYGKVLDPSPPRREGAGRP
eukprot:gene2199-2965_t